MANPVLNDKTFSGEQVAALRTDAGPAGVMTVDGTIARSLVLLAVLVTGGALGWAAVGGGQETVRWPGWLMLALFGGLGIAILTAFKPKAAPYTSPIYALLQGLVVGALSAVYDAAFNGIVVQAVLCTVGVFTLMLFLYASRRVRVTPRMQMAVIGATLGVLVLYGVGWIVGLLTGSYPFQTGALGLLISVVIAGVAAFNLLLDFDFIEQGSNAGAPTYMSWYCAFGVMVTLVWLYLTMLRILAILQGGGGSVGGRR